MKAQWTMPVILLTFIFEGCTPAPATVGNNPNPTSSESQAAPSLMPLSTPSPEPGIQGGEPDLNPSLPIPSRPDPQVLIETAREDLAQRLSVSVTSINLVKIDEILWPDASLGCPQPDNVYAQTQTSGYLIKLEHDEDEFEYHANMHGFIFYCENPTPPISATPVDINP